MLTSGFLKNKYKEMLFVGLFGWLISVAGDLVDGIIAGIFINDLAVSAVSLISPVLSIMYFACGFIAKGTAVMYSEASGEFKKDQAYRIGGMGLTLAVICGAAMMLVVKLLEEPFYTLYGCTGELESYARGYYSMFPLLAIIYPVYWTLYYLVTADGDTKSIFFANIANVIGNAVFSLIFVRSQGTRGLVIGTVLSFLCGGIFIIAHFFKKENSIRLKIGINFKDLWMMVKIGSSGSLATLYVGLLDMIMNKYVIAVFGYAFVPAYTVIYFVRNFGSCFSCAAEVAGSFISVFFGEKNPVSLKKAFNMALRSTVIISCAFLVIMEIAAPMLPDMYGITDPDVIAAAVFAGRVLPLDYIAVGLVFAGIQYYPRIEKIFIGNALGFLYIFAWPMILLYPLEHLLGFKGIVFSFFLSPFATLLAVFIFTGIKYGVKKLPYLLPETDSRIFVHEFAVEPEEISTLNSIVAKELEECGISSKKSTLVQMMIEETFMVVHDKNPGKKVFADCTVIVEPDKIRLITRDSGIIFDITDSDNKVESLNSYVAGRLMATNSKVSYFTTIAFNRNSYVWDR